MTEEERFDQALKVVGQYLKKHHPATSVFFIDHLGYNGEGFDGDTFHIYDVLGFERKINLKGDINGNQS